MWHLESIWRLIQQTLFIQNFLAGRFEVFELQTQQMRRIQELLERYNDLPMDLAEASFVVLAEHLGHGRILTCDRRDFLTYRWNNTHTFENLFLD